MKYLLVIFALIFVGCSEYPVTTIICDGKWDRVVDSDRSYEFVKGYWFKDAEVEIFDSDTSTFKCGAYSQNNSSIKCIFINEDTEHAITYNKLDKTIKERVVYLGKNKERINFSAWIGSCEDA